MNDFTLPPRQVPPPDADGTPPAYLPPKHKKNQAVPQAELSTSSAANEQDEIAALSDEEFDKMLAEALLPVPDKPPQCDWHLGSLFSGNYPDPFTLPILHFAKKSLVVDMAALITAMIKAGAKITGRSSATNIESAYNQPLNDSSKKSEKENL